MNKNQGMPGLIDLYRDRIENAEKDARKEIVAAAQRAIENGQRALARLDAESDGEFYSNLDYARGALNELAQLIPQYMERIDRDLNRRTAMRETIHDVEWVLTEAGK